MPDIPHRIEMDKPMMFETAIKSYEPNYFCTKNEDVKDIFFPY